MKRYPCEETTLDIDLAGVQVRLWVTNHFAAADAEAIREEALDALSDIDSRLPKLRECQHLCEAIAAFGIEGLAAVQVRESSSREGVQIGHMIYTEPFDT